MKKFNLNKKTAATVLASTICISTLTACSDANFKITSTSEYNKAIVVNGNIASIVEISTWSRTTDAENLAIETKDGVHIYTNSTNTYLINDLNCDYTAYDFAKTLVGDDGEIRYFGSIEENTKNEGKVYTNN